MKLSKPSTRNAFACLELSLFLVFIAITSAKSALAAEIERHFHDPNGISIISISGEITSSDARILSRLIDTSKKAIVHLDSIGGNLSAALEIGSKIRLSGASTSVSPGAECLSACALIWLAGSNRYMSQSSIIGFHAAYVDGETGPEEIGVGNAEIGAYLTHLGYSLEVVRLATIAPPDGMLYLSTDLAQAIGINPIVIDEDATETLSQKSQGQILPKSSLL